MAALVKFKEIAELGMTETGGEPTIVCNGIPGIYTLTILYGFFRRGAFDCWINYLALDLIVRPACFAATASTRWQRCNQFCVVDVGLPAPRRRTIITHEYGNRINGCWRLDTTLQRPV